MYNTTTSLQLHLVSSQYTDQISRVQIVSPVYQTYPLIHIISDIPILSSKFHPIPSYLLSIKSLSRSYQILLYLLTSDYSYILSPVRQIGNANQCYGVFTVVYTSGQQEVMHRPVNLENTENTWPLDVQECIAHHTADTESLSTYLSTTKWASWSLLVHFGIENTILDSKILISPILAPFLIAPRLSPRNGSIW